MNNWGSIPDWLSVLIGLLALIGFIIVERERLLLRKQNPNNKAENGDLSSGTENEQMSLTENNVEIRAELYSRILIGIMFGLSLAPLLSWISSGFSPHKDYDYVLHHNIESTVTFLSSLILSSLLTFIYFRAYPKFASVFVHWLERLAFSYLGFWLILVVFSGWTTNSETDFYYIHSYSFINIIVSVIMFLFIGFPSTPVDWIIYLISKSKERKA